ncbi:MAG TPA: 4-hydroxy-tetrahydrodipicolinate synthase [Candidatus Omnitrophota bacterium]|nr:4-hydroxy-tetrahydrodipicolinate synthase [Candidatus Omnitrophota bacterium]
MRFKGSIVALVTPFTKNGEVDEACLQKLVKFHIENGTDGIVPCGTTGESATLNYEEHERVIEICVKAANKKIPVIAGTGSNSTQEAIDLSKHAKDIGADGLLLVSPYYNKPTQKGLYLHFKAIAEAVELPIILYNIASRTAVNIEPETIARLVKDCKNITSVKEASGSLEQMSRIVSLCGKDLTLFSGDDALTLPVMSIGGEGIISVVANIIPKDVKALVEAFNKGDLAEAKRLHYRMLSLIKAMFIETNPIPVKTAMGLMKLCDPSLRLPMCEMGEENLTKLKTVLKEYGLIV